MLECSITDRALYGALNDSTKNVREERRKRVNESMKLKVKPIKRTNNVEMEKPVIETPKKTNNTGKEKTDKKANKLPPDEYKDEIKPVEIPISETNKLVISVKRQGDLGLPHVDIRHYVNTETYTGFTKKGINFPIEYLDEFLLQMTDVMEECDKKKIGIE